jgi:hypothetical protein
MVAGTRVGDGCEVVVIVQLRGWATGRRCCGTNKMISKVISDTKLFRGKIVESVCESLDLGNKGGHPIVVVVSLDSEGVHHTVVVVSESLDLEDTGENPVTVVGIYHAVFVLYLRAWIWATRVRILSLLLCPSIAAVFNVPTLLAALLKPLSLLLCPAIAAVLNVPTLLAAPPKPTGFASGTNTFSNAPARRSVMAMLVIV